jgi:hypothetical protein
MIHSSLTSVIVNFYDVHDMSRYDARHVVEYVLCLIITLTWYYFAISSNMIHSSSTSVWLNFWLMPWFNARWEYDVHDVSRYDASRVLECVLQISMLTKFLSLFDHHVSVIIFCDKFKHDYSSVWLNFWLMLVENIIFRMSRYDVRCVFECVLSW